MKKPNPYARKKRQLKSLSEKLNQLWSVNDRDVSSQIRHLLTKIKKLITELSNVFSGSYLRKVMGAAAFMIFVSFANKADAQNFDPPQVNPFGLDSIPGYFAVPAFADLDNDGDLDLLAGDYYGAMNYFENTGDASNPQFAPVQVNPFGLDSTYMAFVEFGDLDGDGDFDLLVGEYYYAGFQYFENTGSVSAPQFAAPQENPFGLDTLTYFAIPVLADLDNDGDLDLLASEYYGGLSYFENTGSPSNPQFATPQESPFGISTTDFEIAIPEFADLDGDGDLDLMISSYYGNMHYFENTGTPSNPQFAAPQINPFGLTHFQEYGFIEFADLDDDGDLDLMSGEYYGVFKYYENVALVGVKDETDLNLSLYPNPAQDLLNIDTSNKIEMIEISNLAGQIIKTVEYNKQISLNKLKAGTYFVKISFADGAVSTKMINKQ